MTKSKQLSACRLCPRQCNINRIEGTTGYCQSGALVRVALASIHPWEEPSISGTRGSGTIFFTGCNLKCVFCQNYEISQHSNIGKDLTPEELATLFIHQQKKNVHNINLVSPSHFVPQIKEAILIAKKLGLSIPIVYNTNGYDLVETLKQLDGLIDIYLTDLKYYSSDLSYAYSHAKDYFAVASKAISEMYRQVGKNQFQPDGLMAKGVLIRHLILPGCRKDSEKILFWIKETFGDEVYISLLNQYTPMYQAKNIKMLNRRLTSFEYDKTLDYFFSLGLKNGYMQSKTSEKEQYTPSFNLSGLEFLEKK